MPCDLGYKNAARIRVEPKLPSVFRERTKTTKIDKSLLDNMGVDDSVFLDWVSGLDIDPLLQEALKRALERAGDTGNAQFVIVDGELEIQSTYTNDREKKKLEDISRKVSERFQMETFKIIAQLLDYRTVISENKSDGTLTLEAEKEEQASVHKYLRITIGKFGEGVFMFEHFDSPTSLQQERAKFLLLVQKFGIKIHLSGETQSGSPIADGVEHKHFLAHEHEH